MGYEEEKRGGSYCYIRITPQKACYSEISTWVLKRFTTEDSRKIVKNAFGMMRNFSTFYYKHKQVCKKVPQMKADNTTTFQC